MFHLIASLNLYKDAGIVVEQLIVSVLMYVCLPQVHVQNVCTYYIL